MKKYILLSCLLFASIFAFSSKDDGGALRASIRVLSSGNFQAVGLHFCPLENSCTWTSTQTFTNIIINGSCTGCVSASFGNFSPHFFLGNPTGISAVPVSVRPLCGDLGDAAASCSTDTTNGSNISSGTVALARLPSGVVLNNTANTGTTAFTLDMSASTVANAFKVPVGAGLTAGSNGAMAYNTTDSNLHVRVNGTDGINGAFQATPVNGNCVQANVTSGAIVLADSGDPGCNAGGAGLGFAWGGDGSDGAITADGSTTLACLGAPASSTYTLVRDCVFTTLTVNNGVTIKPNGFRILASVSITVNGTITVAGGNGNAGQNGLNSSGGSFGTGGTGNPVNAGTMANAVGQSCVTSSGNSGGSAGSGTTGAGGNGLSGTSGSPGTCTVMFATAAYAPSNWSGGTGGLGAAGAGGGSGSNGGGGGFAATKEKVPRFTNSILLWNGATWGNSNGVGGGGGGGAGGGDGTNTGGGGGGGGGYAASGGAMLLSSPSITVGATGVITADGGTGGAGGTGAQQATGNVGGGGGGAGGQGGHGGLIVLIYHKLVNTGAIHANLGSGGAGGTKGLGRGTGANGTDGAAGPNGLAGFVIQITQ